MKKKHRVGYYVRIVASIIIAGIMFFPIYWLIIASLKPLESLYRGQIIWPGSDFTLRNYNDVVFNAHFWRFFLNSVVVGILATCFVIVLSTLGAYSLARLKFWGSDWFANTVLFVYMVPKVLLAIPLYVWMYKMGLLNTQFSVIMSHVAIGLPFALWMLRGFFATLPESLEDAARIDGCSWFGVLTRIILPLSGAGIVATAMFTFINSWNDYLFAYMLINKSSLQTLPVGLVNLFTGSDSQEWGQIMAASVLSSIPVVLFFLILQKYMVRGLTTGATKG